MEKLGKEDQLETLALEIATQNLLKGKSLKQLSQTYPYAPSTIHRRLKTWLAADRFELVDKLESSTTEHVIDIDGRLGEMLAKKTKIWRARVARISGVDAAYTHQYLEKPDSPEALKAYRDGDGLHKALGEVAADCLLNSLRRNFTVGLASGRGVGFTILKLAELAQEKPSWVSGYESVHIVSLCGGGHVGTWAIPTILPLDADQNAFALASILQVPKDYVTYMGGWISADRNRPRQNVDLPYSLDLALVGLGQLNTRHHFFHHYGEVQMGAMVEPLQRIRDWQSKSPELLYRVADIGHRLFPVGEKELPPDFVKAINEINESILAIPPRQMRQAGEVILVSGGAQKAAALCELVTGGCPEAPIDLRNLTLITDAWTASYILSRIENSSF